MVSQYERLRKELEGRFPGMLDVVSWGVFILGGGATHPVTPPRPS